MKLNVLLLIVIIVAAVAVAILMSGTEQPEQDLPIRVDSGEPVPPLSATEELDIPDSVGDIFIGQTRAGQAIPNGLDAKSLVQPNWVAVDTSVEPYRLYVVDSQNFRLLGYKDPLMEPPVVADLVLGQQSMDSSTFYEEETGPEKVWIFHAVVVDATGNVYVTDSNHHRILEYDRPFETDTYPDRVFGQPDFYSMKPDFGRAGLAFPKGMCIDHEKDILWVADAGNNRVLAYYSPLADATADFIIGQNGEFNSRESNKGGAVSAGSLYAPMSVSLRGEDLIVTDFANNRVLYYIEPLTTDATADYVFGQDGRFDTAEGGCSPYRLNNPEAAIADASGNILISDSRNHRVLLYPPPESRLPQPIGLWGQWQSLHTSEPNFRGLSPESFEYPVGVALSPDNRLWVADRHNHRVLCFDGGTMGDKAADHVIGQIDLYHNAPNFLDEHCLFFPRDLAVDRWRTPNRLYVADFENNRVLGFKSIENLKTGQGADIVLCQEDFYSNRQGGGPSGVNLPPSVAVAPDGGIFVADRENSRVLYFKDPYSDDATADLVIGQPDFFSYEANAGGEVSASGLNRPEGICVDKDGNLYVADSRNHRVLRFDDPVRTDTVADFVWGQVGDFTLADKHSFGEVQPGGFAFPFKVAISDDGMLAVADTENHRVLLFDTAADSFYMPAKVYGQQGSYETGVDNIGGAVSASGLSGPEGMCFRGEDLYIADTSNNRVLFFEDYRNGDDVADRVYGQANMNENYIGVARVSAQNLWLPSGIDLDSDGNLYVTDREQSRVVIFEK